MKSAVMKRSVHINGHKTSVSLEQEFWEAVKEIAEVRDVNIKELVAEIDKNRAHKNLSSALRVFVLGYYLDKVPNPRRY